MRITRHIFFVAVALGLLFVGHSARAYTLEDADTKNFLGTVSEKSGITNKDVPTIVGVGLKGAIGLMGIFFFILMVYGGFLWMTARGNDEQVTKAQDLIKDAIIGMIVVVMAYGITVAVGKMIG